MSSHTFTADTQIWVSHIQISIRTYAWLVTTALLDSSRSSHTFRRTSLDECPEIAIPSNTMARPLELYDVPYPSRDDPNIASLIWAKREFRECQSGPRVSEDVRVSDTFYNMQVFFQRYMVAYRSVLLYWKQGSGKTGAYKCFQQFMKNTHPGDVTAFYYFCGKSQINDFNEQVSVQFGNATTREEFEKASGKTLKGAYIVKRVHNERSNLVRRNMRNERYQPMTYGKFRKIVDGMSNEQIIKTFRNASFFIDEAQFIKLDEDKDTSIKRDKEEAKESRNRVKIYEAFYRVSRLCPDCYFVVSTGTPNTNRTSDFIYQANLLPGNRIIWTPVSQSIAENMWQKHGIPMPTEDEWVDIDLKAPQEELERQLEEILRGKVLYATAPETDAVKTYMTPEVIAELEANQRFPFSLDDDFVPEDWSVHANPDPYMEFPTNYVENYDFERWRTIEYDPDTHRTMATYVMSPYQTANYNMVHNVSENVHSSARQASLFVFPTKEYIDITRTKGIAEANRLTNYAGLIGQDAFDHYCKLKKIRLTQATGTTSYKQRVERTTPTYEATPLFKSYVKDLENVKNSGIKIYEVIVHALNPKVGPMTCASTYVHLTCLLIGVILKVHGFQEYNPEIENIYRKGALNSEKRRPRYAILGTSNKGVHQEILRLAGHPDNVRGEYLKLVLITPVSSTGLNIVNMEYGFFIDPPFTQAQLEQSERRIIRPNSQINSFAWAREHWGVTSFALYIFYMIAQPNAQMAEEDGFNPIENREWSMYASMYQKDADNARIMRALKRIAIDAQANLSRNIRPDIEDGTLEADYVEAEYTPYNCDTSLDIDNSTYDSYYAARELDIPRSKIHDYFMSLPGHVAATIQDMVVAFEGKYTEVELMIYLKSMVEEQIISGTDAFGIDVILSENSGVLYLSREITSVTDPSLEYYSNFLALQSAHTLESIVSDFLDEAVLETYKKEIEESDSHRDYISKYVPNAYKSKLLEDAFVMQYSGTDPYDMPLWAQRILIATYMLHTQLITESGPIVVHQVNSLYNGTGSGTNYNPVDSVLKASQQLRIMIVRQGLVWQDCTKPEAETYSKLLNGRFESELKEMYQEFSDVGCVGIIVRYDAVHIRRFDVNGEIVENKGTGKNSRGFKLKALLPLMYRASTPLANRDPVLYADHEALVDGIHADMASLTRDATGLEILDELSTQELQYYRYVLDRVKDEGSDYSPAKELCQNLLEIGAIYTVIGDSRKTVNRVGE